MTQILAHHGFQKPFLDYFKYVSPGDGAVCGNAMLFRRINFLKDLMEDPAYMPHREIIRNAGIRSVISYPLLLAGNSFAGMISAHWKTLVDGGSLPDASPLLTELKEFLYENRTETGN